MLGVWTLIAALERAAERARAAGERSPFEPQAPLPDNASRAERDRWAKIEEFRALVRKTIE